MHSNEVHSQAESAPAAVDQSPRKSKPRRRVVRLLAMIATVLGLTVGTVAIASPAWASWHSATVGWWTPSPGVMLRDCYHPSTQLPPSTSCTPLHRVPAGTAMHVVCQRSGENISGNPVWDYVVYSGGEGFVSDYYMNTGYANWIPGVDICT